MHFYTDEQREFVKVHIKGRSRKDLQKMFNDHFVTELKLNQITAFIKNNGFKSGLDKRFKEGRKSWNKGMKGLQTGGEKGWFKKGQRPYNYKPVGFKRIDRDGYVLVKVSDEGAWHERWKHKQKVVWEKENGPIPKGCAVLFGDGNRRNFDPNNLILVTRSQLALLNKNNLIQSDADLTRTGIIIADIYKKVGERKS